MKQQRTGFTLVETLVVIMILIALSAVIFGALGPAREKSRQRVCASNLHQWGMAFAMYIQDYDGADPQIGTPMTHSELGLPPHSDLWNFMKQYKIWGTAVMNCPSAHYTSPRHPVSSYGLAGIFFDEDTFPGYASIVSEIGPELALVSCEMHNVDTNFLNQPSWAKKWEQTVHLDQHVTFRQVKAVNGLLSD